MNDMKGYYFNKLASTVYSGLNNIYSLSALGIKTNYSVSFTFYLINYSQHHHCTSMVSLPFSVQKNSR